MLDDLDPKEFEATARAVMEACGEAPDAAARAGLLAEAGLLGVSAPEDIGGLGLGLDFAIPIVSAAGAGLLGFPLIEAMLLSRALAKVAPEVAGTICTGQAVGTIAWNGTLEAGKVAAAPLAGDATHCLVFCKDGTAILIETAGLQPEMAIDDLDLELPTGAFALTAAEGPALDAAAVAALREDAKMLRAAFALGSATTCLDLAIAYSQDRVQFGKPLSANQVLRHRMSRDTLALETTRNAITRALAEPAEGAGEAREAAWQAAAHYGPAVAESAIQIFGGMGFTWEVPLHRHLRQMLTQNAHGAAAAGLAAVAARLMQTPTNSWYEDIQSAV